MVKFDDTVCLRGKFKLDVFKEKDGVKTLIESIEEDNLIVNLARESMAHLLAGDGANRQMKYISFGTNSTTPTVDDTQITNAFTKQIGSVTNQPIGQAIFKWTLTTAEANGLAIMEFGMLTADNKLFCRRTRTTPINKQSDISLEGTWTIQF